VLTTTVLLTRILCVCCVEDDKECLAMRHGNFCQWCYSMDWECAFPEGSSAAVGMPEETSRETNAKGTNVETVKATVATEAAEVQATLQDDDEVMELVVPVESSAEGAEVPDVPEAVAEAGAEAAAEGSRLMEG
jgi:hypothetical protein